MNDLDVRTGPNYACAHVGRFADLGRYRFRHPLLEAPARGKLFLKDVLGMTGAEVSLNVLPAGKGMPFLHRHDRNEELYLFVGGRGQVQVDGEAIDVAEGSVLRISPAAARAWRNHSDEDLYYVVIQYRADSPVGGTTTDGVAVPGLPQWPDSAS